MPNKKKTGHWISALFLVSGVVLAIFGFIKLMKSDDLSDNVSTKPKQTVSDVSTNNVVNVKSVQVVSSPIYSEGQATFTWGSGNRPTNMPTEEEVRRLKQQNQTPTVKSLAQ